jgi:hypothetical protein
LLIGQVNRLARGFHAALMLKFRLGLVCKSSIHSTGVAIDQTGQTQVK